MILRKVYLPMEGRESYLRDFLHTTAVVVCYVVNKRKVRREETPTILRKKRIGFAMEKRKKEKKKTHKKNTPKTVRKNIWNQSEI